MRGTPHGWHLNSGSSFSALRSRSRTFSQYSGLYTGLLRLPFLITDPPCSAPYRPSVAVPITTFTDPSGPNCAGNSSLPSNRWVHTPFNSSFPSGRLGVVLVVAVDVPA